jgi:hypothetical protein
VISVPKTGSCKEARKEIAGSSKGANEQIILNPARKRLFNRDYPVFEELSLPYHN